METEIDNVLAAWQQRCQAQGLSLTASRRAILRALMEQHEARDVVPLLQAAQLHHAQTSIGTLYRFLRELEQRGLVDAYAQPHGRMHWQLREFEPFPAAFPAPDVRRILRQAQEFLRRLACTGLAEPVSSHGAQQDCDDKRTLAVLHDMASQFGYRLLPEGRDMYRAS